MPTFAIPETPGDAFLLGLAVLLTVISSALIIYEAWEVWKADKEQRKRLDELDDYYGADHD